MEGPSAPLAADVPPGLWSAWNALRRTWAVYRRDWVLLTLPFFIEVALQMLEDPILKRIPFEGDAAFAFRGTFTVARTALWSLLEAGWLLQWVAAAKGRQPTYAQLREGLALAVPVVLIALLVKFTLDLPNTWRTAEGSEPSKQIYVFGHLFVSALISPAYTLWACVAVAERRSFGAALHRTWQLTAGYRTQLLACGFIYLLLILGGFLACFIGILPAGTLMEGLMVVVYLRLRSLEEPSESAARPASERSGTRDRNATKIRDTRALPLPPGRIHNGHLRRHRGCSTTTVSRLWRKDGWTI